MILLALALGATGLVWIGQGLGVIRGSSPMTDDVRWAIAGAGLIAVGVVVGAIAILRTRA
jgi:hypothetical protein